MFIKRMRGCLPFRIMPAATKTCLRRIAELLLLVVSITLFSNHPASAQPGSYVFSHVDVNQGLSDNWVKCIYRDPGGFVWFGTNSGLNRFDGYNFEYFGKEEDDSASITDDAVNVMTGDNNGSIWIGTRSGVSILDLDTYNIRNIGLVPSPALQCQDIAYITAIASDAGGNIMIGTHNGAFFYSRGENSFRHVLIDEQSCSSDLNNITAITFDRSGSFWLGTNNGFLIRYSYSSNYLEKTEIFKEQSDPRGIVTALFADRDNNLWVGDINGLSLFEIDKQTWNSDFRERSGRVFRKLRITGIDQDPKGRIWVASDGYGLFLVDRTTYNLTNIRNTPYLAGSLSSNGIASLLCDNSGIIWAGTSKKGVDFYKDNIRKFRLLRNSPNDPGTLSNNDVDCLAEDHKGNLWIGTNGGGLNYLDRKTGKISQISSTGRNNMKLSSNVIVSLLEDSGKKLWIGTYMGGLNYYDPLTGELRVYRYDESDSTSISDDRIWGICEDSRKNIWIATLTSGLNRFDRKTGKFVRYNSQNSPICFNYLNSISVDSADNLWISSANGLIRFNPSANRASCWYSNPSDSTSLSDNQVISTFEDSRGLFWVCTNNGLNLMDRSTGKFRTFTIADGLPSNKVLRVLEDINKDLWISTKNGISRLIIGIPDGETGVSARFINFGISDNLQGKEFTETAALATRDGELWFGGPDGLNSFYPDEIRADSTPTTLAFTGFRIFDRPVIRGEKVNNRILLETPVFNTNRLILKYRENSFTVDFVALNYFHPEKNRYRYRLDGFSTNWISTEGSQNSATFSNLNNGTYTLRVNATNADGIWNEEGISLRIKVLPPFWKSWYAYLIYSVMIMGTLAALRYMILYRERLNMKIEQEKIESMHVHEIDALKIRFFTNISHELRTPLTLILSPVEKLLDHFRGSADEKHLKLIQQNARRLLLMINQLLDFRRMEVQGFGFNPSYGDISKFIANAVASFDDLSEQKNIRLLFSSGVTDLCVWFDRDKIEKVVFNLLSNAFKFTPAGGTVTVNMFLEDAGGSGLNGSSEKLVIKVTDTGIGIPADKTGGLFNYFYQVDSSGNDSGTGLGLALVREFVRLHNGEVSVESSAGKGSCFIVTLPVARKRDTKDEDDHQIENAGLTVPASQSAAEGNGDQVRKRVIVLAEDNDDLRFYLKDNLKEKFSVYEAANGEEALDAAVRLVPDLVISDVFMPVITGKELCKRLKSDRRLMHIPVILMTAHTGEREEYECIEAGADDFITKPFSFQILEARINNFINLLENQKNNGHRTMEIKPDEINIIPLDEQFIKKAIELAEKNISRIDYTVEELSNDLGISRTLLYKKILSLTGKPPLEFIRTIRMKRAAQLLEKSQLNVSEIAYRVGYNDPKYFRKHFKKEFGVLPSQYSGKPKT